MIQAMRKKLRGTRDTIAWLAGASPLILALILMHIVKVLSKYHNTEWIKYSVQHQDDITQALIISSIAVAVFSAALCNRMTTLRTNAQR